MYTIANEADAANFPIIATHVTATPGATTNEEFLMINQLNKYEGKYIK